MKTVDYTEAETLEEWSGSNIVFDDASEAVLAEVGNLQQCNFSHQCTQTTSIVFIYCLQRT